MTTSAGRTDHGVQAARIAPIVVLHCALMYWFRSSLWIALPAAGLALTVPPFVSCVWRWWRAR